MRSLIFLLCPPKVRGAKAILHVCTRCSFRRFIRYSVRVFLRSATISCKAGEAVHVHKKITLFLFLYYYFFQPSLCFWCWDIHKRSSTLKCCLFWSAGHRQLWCEKIQERASKSQKLDLYLADLPFKVIFLWTSVLLLESLLFLGHIEIISIGHGPLCRCLCGVCWIFSRASKDRCFNIFSQSQHNCRKVNLACKDWVGVAINSAFSCQNMMSLWHAPKFKSFLLNVLPQMLQDVTIEIYFDSLTLGDQFMVHNLVNVKKKMMSMLPVLLLTWRAAFRLGNGELFNKKLLHSHSWRPSSHQQW